MGKKPKVNKLARMSDEERARYLQHRADMEEEARRRKRELIAKFIKNKLDKEEAYSRINTAKINQGWRYILRKIKCKQMMTDIQGMMNSFNFMMDRKERQLSLLMRAVSDADEQHRRAFQSHTETLSYFINIGYQRLNKLQTEYEYQKNTLLENWDKEEMDTVDAQERADYKLKLIIYIQEKNFNKYNIEKDLERATAKNDARLEHEEDLRSVCKPRQFEIEMYWSQLREVYRSYIEQHEPIIAHYNSLREKDEFYQRDIARNEVHIQHAQELLGNLEKECINTTNVMANKIHRMTTHKEALSKRYWQMKREDKSERRRANEKLEVMVNASQDAIEYLEKMKEKIAKIHELAEICRKYENSKDEAVYKEFESDDNPIDYKNLDPAMVEECQEYRKLDKFMAKMNSVYVQTLCLKAEKAKLFKENVQVKQYIKRYLTELALKGGRERPLSMKIHSDMQKIDSRGKILNRPVTCIEGALSNAVMHEKRMEVEKRNRQMELITAYPRVQCWMKTA